jgi:hypothetical protein
MTLNIYATQLYVDRASKFAAFSHVFNSFLHHELSSEMFETPDVDSRLIDGWTLMFRFVVYPNDSNPTETKGPQLLRKTKDMEYGVHIRGKKTLEEVFDELMTQVIAACQNLGIDTAKFENKLPMIKQQIFEQQETMFFN